MEQLWSPEVRSRFRSDSGFIHVADEFERNPFGGLRLDTESKNAEPAKPRVLVVDDEKLIADNKPAKFSDGAGFHAPGCLRWLGGSRYRREVSSRTIFLIDVLMPRMNGVELAIAIIKMSPATRIVLFSGQAGISEILLKGHDLGYEFDLVAKPIHPIKLIECLRESMKIVPGRLARWST